MAMIATVAGETAPWWRAHDVAVQPFNNAASKGLGLGLRTWQAAIELGDAGPLVEEDLLVIGRPAVPRRAQQQHDLGLVPPQEVEHAGRRRGGSLEHQVVAIHREPDAGSACRLHGFSRAHGRSPRWEPPRPQLGDFGDL
jgi:hypothetical protein